jgi:mRNA-degrading endonuclease RelE of RelBE toxin-antitoxin system
MEFKLIYKPVALLDSDEAATWYNQKIQGLGFRFLLDLEITIENLIRNPFAYSVLKEPVRKASLKKFPYVVLYVIVSNNIIVIGIINTKRSRSYFKSRIKNR